MNKRKQEQGESAHRGSFLNQKFQSVCVKKTEFGAVKAPLARLVAVNLPSVSSICSRRRRWQHIRELEEHR